MIPAQKKRGVQWIGENKREAGARAGQAQAGEGGEGERVEQEKKAMEKIPCALLKINGQTGAQSRPR